MDLDSWKEKSARTVLGCCRDVKSYTHRGDVLLNKYMRRGYLLKPLESLYLNMNKALMLTPPIPIGTVLYRGIKGKYSDMLIGDFFRDITKFTDYGFTSFSLNEDTAMEFTYGIQENNQSVVILRLTIDKEIHGIYLDNNKDLSYYEESEVVIGPKTKYEITNFEHDANVSIWFDIKISYEYNQNELDFKYKKIDFIPQFFNMIEYFQSNNDDIFLIGQQLYFTVDPIDIDEHVYNMYFKQSVEISTLLNDNRYQEPKNFMSFVLQKKNKCFYLIEDILSAEPLYVIKNGKTFISYLMKNIKRNTNPVIKLLNDSVFTNKYNISDLIYKMTNTKMEFEFTDKYGDNNIINYEEISYPPGCEIEW